MKRRLFKTFIPLFVISTVISPLLLTSCGETGIVLANYEGYMSPDLIDRLRSVNGSSVSYVSYSTNEDIQAKFKNSYDVAIPSTYMVLELIEEGQLAKLDYSKFNITANKYNPNTPNQSQPISDAWPKNTYPREGHNDPQTDPTNIQCLLSPVVCQIIDSVDD
jgi:spermidine/putrescine-binding protein